MISPEPSGERLGRPDDGLCSYGPARRRGGMRLQLEDLSALENLGAHTLHGSSQSTHQLRGVQARTVRGVVGSAAARNPNVLISRVTVQPAQGEIRVLTLLRCDGLGTQLGLLQRGHRECDAPTPDDIGVDVFSVGGSSYVVDAVDERPMHPALRAGSLLANNTVP